MVNKRVLVFNHYSMSMNADVNFNQLHVGCKETPDIYDCFRLFHFILLYH